MFPRSKEELANLFPDGFVFSETYLGAYNPEAKGLRVGFEVVYDLFGGELIEEVCWYGCVGISHEQITELKMALS